MDPHAHNEVMDGSGVNGSNSILEFDNFQEF